jgi:hypothetical protein
MPSVPFTFAFRNDALLGAVGGRDAVRTGDGFASAKDAQSRWLIV